MAWGLSPQSVCFWHSRPSLWLHQVPSPSSRRFPGSSLGSTSLIRRPGAAGPGGVQLGSSLPQELPSSSSLHLSHRSQIPRPLLRYSSCSSGFLLHLFSVLRDAFLNSSLLTFLGLGPLTKRPFHLGPKTSGNPPKYKSTPSI